MNRKEQYLDDIFQKAKNQEPKISFEETSERFLESVVAIGGTTLLMNWLSKLLSLKGGVLLTGSLATIAFVVFTSRNYINQNLNAIAVEPVQSGTIQSINLPSHPQVFSVDQQIDTATAAIQNKVRQEFISPMTILPSFTNLENIQLRSINTEKPRDLKVLPPLLPDIPKQDDKAILFTITERTVEEEFHRISKIAKTAGIDFKNQVHRQRVYKFEELFLIRDFKIDMTIPGDTSRIKVAVPKRGKFSLTFGWYVDQENKVIRLTEDIEIKEASEFYPKK